MIRILKDSSESIWLEIRYRISFEHKVGDCPFLEKDLANYLEHSETVISVSQISAVGNWVYEAVQTVHLDYPDFVSLEDRLLNLWKKIADDQNPCHGLERQWSNKIEPWYAELM